MNPNGSTKKTILLVAAANSMFYLPVARALEELGFEVHFVNEKGTEVLRNASIIHKFARRLPTPIKNYVFQRSYRTIDNRILNATRKLKPDFVLVLKAKYLGIEMLDKLRKMTTTMNWYPETTNTMDTLNLIVSHYDYFFEFDNYIVDMFEKRGYDNIYYLPFCGDVEKNAQWPDEKKDIDVVFLGSYDRVLYPMRLKILEQIKDLGLKVYGNKAWAETPLKDIFCGPLTATTEEIKKLYARAKIVIHMDALTTHTGTGLTMRPFDVASIGSLLLAQDDRAELFDFFEDGKELISFHGPKDIRPKVEYFLKHDEERKKIAKAGFDKVRSRHTYLDRMKHVFEIAKSKNLH